MSIETERIYKITEDNFYGITQGTRLIVDSEGDITGQVQNPVATIRYDDRLITVQPHQVEFIDEEGKPYTNVQDTWGQFKNDYHTEITQELNNLRSVKSTDVETGRYVGRTIFLLEKILSDMEG